MKGLRSQLAGILAVVGILLLLAAGGYYLVVGEFDLYDRILAGLGAALLVYAALERPESVERGVSSRGLRFGGNALVLTIAVLGILALVNYISANRSQRWDLTQNQQFTLSPQTIQVLQRLNQPIDVKMFFSPGTAQSAEDLIKEYVARTDKLTYEIVDPEANPGLARQLGVRSFGTVVFIQGDRKQETTTTTESGFTGAILRVTQPPRTIYFTTGHQELDINQGGQQGMSLAREFIQRENVVVSPLSLPVSQTVPSDASAVIVAGGQRPFSEGEVGALRTYLQNGGRVLIMRDPQGNLGLDDLIREWGIELKPGVAVDPRQSLPNDPVSVIVATYPSHPIVQPFQNVFSVFPFMSYVGRAPNAPPDFVVTPLLQTTEAGWLETDQQRVEFNQDADTRGPVPIAVAVEKRPAAGASGPLTRLVVFGGSTFGINQLVGSPQLVNVDILANSISWLTESEELLSIRPKDPGQNQLTMTGVQANFLVFSSLLFLPLIVVIIGIVVWWRRR